MEFVFYSFLLAYFYSLLRYQISFQNLMFSALKPKSLSSALLIILRWENNKPSEHKPCHRSSYPHHLTICESTFRFLLTIFLATDLSTTFFPFIISKVMFFRLLFLELLLFLLPFTPVYHQAKIWLTCQPEKIWERVSIVLLQYYGKFNIRWEFRQVEVTLGFLPNVQQNEIQASFF